LPQLFKFCIKSENIQHFGFALDGAEQTQNFPLVLSYGMSLDKVLPPSLNGD
jgi:hypothetical protein